LAIYLAARAIDGVTDTAAADIMRAEGFAEQALAASPRSLIAHNAKGQVLRAQGRYDEAIPEYEGETERAAAELAEARRLNSDGRFSSIARLKAAKYLGVPKVRALYKTTYLVGLRKAGMPDE